MCCSGSASSGHRGNPGWLPGSGRGRSQGGGAREEEPEERLRRGLWEKKVDFEGRCCMYGNVAKHNKNLK